MARMPDMKTMLDQLMGKDRNLTQADKKAKQVKWDDPSICRWFLAGFCPNLLFTNTKSDLGICSKEHDEKAKEDFQAQPEAVKSKVELEWYRHLAALQETADNEIRRGEGRLAMSQGSEEEKDQETKDLEKKVGEIGDQMRTLMAQMEELGEEGKVDEAQSMLALVESLKTEKTDLEKQLKERAEKLRPSVLQGAGDVKRMKVCDVCAAFLVVNDAEQRVSAHIQGKQHQGYEKIRTAVKELKAKYGNIRDANIERARYRGDRSGDAERGGGRDDRRGGGAVRDRDGGDRDRYRESGRGRGGRDDGRGGYGYGSGRDRYYDHRESYGRGREGYGYDDRRSSYDYRDRDRERDNRRSSRERDERRSDKDRHSSSSSSRRRDRDDDRSPSRSRSSSKSRDKSSKSSSSSSSSSSRKHSSSRQDSRSRSRSKSPRSKRTRSRSRSRSRS